MRPQYSRDPGDHTELTPDKLVTFVLQDHRDRRGQHLDIRLGDRSTGLFSWASRHPNLPKPGQDPTAIFRAAKHPYGWGYYQGPLRDGGQVRVKERGKAKITESDPDNLGFNLVNRDPVDAYLFKKLTENSWLAINRNPEAIASVLNKVKEAGEAKSPPIYHGSSIADLKRIDPRPSRVLGGEQAVFGTPDRDLAISFGQPWRDADFEQGYRDGQPYMREQYEGAFEKIFGGKPGALYTLPGAGFASDPRLMRAERISRAGVTPEAIEHIADALAALRATRFQLEPYQPREKAKEANAADKSAASAVVIKGNPKYIAGNSKADAFYEAIRQHLAASGYDVSFDPGEPHTAPPPADLWVGHSRGADRLRFAPAGTRTLPIGSHRPGAVNHPDDDVTSGGAPNDSHYVLTDEMREALLKTAGAAWRSPAALKSILGRMGVSLSSRAQGLAHVRNQLVGSPELPGVQKFVSKLPKIDGLDLLPDVPIAKAKSWEPGVVFRGSTTDGSLGPHGYRHATPWPHIAMQYAEHKPPDLSVRAPSFVTAYKTAPGQPYFRDFGIENRDAPRSATQALEGAKQVLTGHKQHDLLNQLGADDFSARANLQANTYETPVYPEVNPVAQRYFKGMRSTDLHELPLTPAGESFYRSLSHPLGQWTPKSYPKTSPWLMPAKGAPAGDPIAVTRRALPPVHPEEAFHPTPAPALHTPENPLSLDELTKMLQAKGLDESAIQSFQKMWQANSKVAGLNPDVTLQPHQERGDDGTCNRCCKPWPKEAVAPVLSGHYETIQSQDRGQVRAVGSDRPSAKQAEVSRQLVDLPLHLRDGEGHKGVRADQNRQAPDAFLRLLRQGAAHDTRPGAYEDVPSLARHAQPVLQPQRQDVPPLRRPGDYGLRKLAEVRGVFCGHGSSTAGLNPRTEGQQQGLFAGQLSLGDHDRAGEKQAEQSSNHGRRGNTPGVGLGGTERGASRNYQGATESGLLGRGGCVAPIVLRSQWDKSAGIDAPGMQPYQQRVVRRVADGQSLLVWHGLGTGKTRSAIEAAKAVGGPYTAVTPASLRNNFRGEIDRWSDKSSPAEVMSFNAAAAGKEPAYDPNTLIVDEAQTIRNPESQKAKGVERLAEKARRLVLLSGTPIVNGPGDLAEPLYLLTGKRYSPEAFEQRFTKNEKVYPGFFKRLMGVEPGVRRTVNHRDELVRMLKGHVDYQPAATPEGVTTHDERVEVDMSPEQAKFHELAWGKLPFFTRWKLQHQFPLAPREVSRLSAFMTGPRQASLSLGKYTDNDPQRAYNSSPKLREAGERLQKALQDPRVKALVFSNFPGAGLKPYADHLKRQGVPAAMFDGSMSDAERKKAVDDYNANKLRVLMLGPAGSEGISTKGTQLIQLLDPHFNAARSDQSRGRGLRFDSHTGLPEDLRNVNIQRFIARTPEPSWLKRQFGTERHPSSDEILERMAAEKEKLNEEFRGVLRDSAQY